MHSDLACRKVLGSKALVVTVCIMHGVLCCVHSLGLLLVYRVFACFSARVLLLVLHRVCSPVVVVVSLADLGANIC